MNESPGVLPLLTDLPTLVLQRDHTELDSSRAPSLAALEPSSCELTLRQPLVRLRARAACDRQNAAAGLVAKAGRRRGRGGVTMPVDGRRAVAAGGEPCESMPGHMWCVRCCNFVLNKRLSSHNSICDGITRQSAASTSSSASA